MEKKYYYNLENGSKEYTLEEIAERLDLDVEYIAAILDTDREDIDYACMQATKEKINKKNVEFLLNNFSSSYFSKKGIFPVLENYLKIRKNKHSLINSLEINLENFHDDYMIISRKGLNLLTVNTDLNFDKPTYNREDLKYMKSIQTLAIEDNIESDKNRLNILDKKDIPSILLSKAHNPRSLFLTVDATKTLLEVTKNHKLPKVYNELVFDEIISDNSNTSTITYIRK